MVSFPAISQIPVAPLHFDRATVSVDDPGLQLLRQFGTEALMNNPSILSARMEALSRSSERDAAWHQFLPTPSVSIDQADQPARTLLNEKTRIYRLQQPIWSGGRLSANLAQAEASLRGSQHNQTAQEQGTLEQLIQTIARLRQASLRMRSLDASVSTHERLLMQVRRRTTEGLSASADLTVAQSRLLNVKSELGSAANEIQQQLMLLRRLLGRPLTSEEQSAIRTLSAPAVPDETNASPNDDELNPIARQQPRVLKLLADQEQLQQRIRSQKANRLPQLSLRLDRTHGSLTGIDNVAVLSLTTSWGAGLSNEHEIRALEHRSAALEQETQADIQENLRRLSVLREDLSVQIQRHLQLDKSLQHNREFLESTERLYLTGRKAWLDVLNAAREVSATEIAASDALLQAWNNVTLLRLLAEGPQRFLQPDDPGGVTQALVTGDSADPAYLPTDSASNTADNSAEATHEPIPTR